MGFEARFFGRPGPKTSGSDREPVIRCQEGEYPVFEVGSPEKCRIGSLAVVAGRHAVCDPNLLLIRGGSAMRVLCFLFLLVFVAAVGGFAYYNQQEVTLRFLNWT